MPANARPLGVLMSIASERLTEATPSSLISSVVTGSLGDRRRDQACRPRTASMAFGSAARFGLVAPASVAAFGKCRLQRRPAGFGAGKRLMCFPIPDSRQKNLGGPVKVAC
jgi:hypothetical protein